MSENKKVLYDEQGLQAGCLYPDLSIFVTPEGKVIEALSQREAQEPVAWGVMKRGERVWYINDSKATCQGYANHYGHRLANGMDLDQEVIPLYTATLSSEIPQKWRNAIDALVKVAQASYRAADDSEEREGDDGREHVISSHDFDELSNALDLLDELPEPDDPNQEYSGPMRAAAMLTAAPKPEQPAHIAQTDNTGADSEAILHEAPELTDEGICQLAEKIDGIERHKAWGELIVRHSNGSWVTVERMLIQFARAVIAADRAKRGGA